MIVHVRTTLDRKYMHPGCDLTDPYTEERHGYLYLVSDNPSPLVKQVAVRCDAIVSIDIVAVTA